MTMNSFNYNNNHEYVHKGIHIIKPRNVANPNILVTDTLNIDLTFLYLNKVY